MCDLTKNEEYADKWNDYFTYVNSTVYKKLLHEECLYIAYGAYNDLPVEDIKHWYKDAERYLVSANDPGGYIAHKYNMFVLSEDDLEYFIDQEVDDGMLYENMGYWFRA